MQTPKINIVWWLQPLPLASVPQSYDHQAVPPPLQAVAGSTAVVAAPEGMHVRGKAAVVRWGLLVVGGSVADWG